MKEFGMFILWIFIFASLFIVFGFIVAATYNATIPYIFGLPEINLGQGICLYVLTRTLFVARFNVGIDKHK
jgi:hypothetical protein